MKDSTISSPLQDPSPKKEEGLDKKGSSQGADPNLLQEKIIAQSIAKVADSHLSSLLGRAVIFLCMMGLILVWKWDGHLYDRRGCIHLQTIGSRIFKVNSCDGDWEEIPSLSQKP